MKYLPVAPPSAAATEKYTCVSERADATGFSTLRKRKPRRAPSPTRQQ